MVRRVLLLTAFALTLAAPAAAAPLPVPWDASSLASGGQHPDSTPGANDFSCKPSAEHPRPVVLVHGLLATMGSNWPTMSPLLKNNGFCVFALTYGRKPGNPYFGGLTPMESSAEELRVFVDRVLAATGTTQVDMVSHSQGTIMPRWWMSFMGGAAKVHRWVLFTPLWEGTTLAGSDTLLQAAKLLPNGEQTTGTTFDAAGCGSCPEFVKGSRYLADVDRAGRALPGIEYTNVMTKHDELVVPYTSGNLDAPGVRNIVLQDVCAKDNSEHAAVAYDPMAAQIMLNTLDPARARPVPCVDMSPAGAPNPPDVGLASAPTPVTASSCPVGRPLRVRVGARRGERIRRITATVSGRRVAVRRGKALRSIVLERLPSGRRAIRLRLTDQHGRSRTVTVRRTVRCG